MTQSEISDYTKVKHYLPPGRNAQHSYRIVRSLKMRCGCFFERVFMKYSNDLVLVVLWAMASLNDKSYISVMICFIVFFVNDMYGFINWKRMEKFQREHSKF